MSLSDRLVSAMSVASFLRAQLKAERAEARLHGPRSGEEFCLICGLIRLDPDPTGFTCGSFQCIEEFFNQRRETIEFLRKFTGFCEEQGFSKPKDIDNLEEVIRQFGVFDSIMDEIEMAAEELGIETEQKPLWDCDKASDLMKRILDEIANLKNSIGALEKI